MGAEPGSGEEAVTILPRRGVWNKLSMNSQAQELSDLGANAMVHLPGLSNRRQDISVRLWYPMCAGEPERAFIYHSRRIR